MCGRVLNLQQVQRVLGACARLLLSGRAAGGHVQALLAQPAQSRLFLLVLHPALLCQRPLAHQVFVAASAGLGAAGQRGWRLLPGSTARPLRGFGLVSSLEEQSHCMLALHLHRAAAVAEPAVQLPTIGHQAHIHRHLVRHTLGTPH